MQPSGALSFKEWMESFPFGIMRHFSNNTFVDQGSDNQKRQRLFLHLITTSTYIKDKITMIIVVEI